MGECQATKKEETHLLVGREKLGNTLKLLKSSGASSSSGIVYEQGFQGFLGVKKSFPADFSDL